MNRTVWKLTDRQQRVKNVTVAARTQRQLERSKKNAFNPPAPRFPHRRVRPS